MKNEITNLGGERVVSTMNNPFNKSSVVDITVYSRKSDFRDEIYHRGSVEFVNGNTRGTQRFEGTSFDDVVMQIKRFIDKEL